MFDQRPCNGLADASRCARHAETADAGQARVRGARGGRSRDRDRRSRRKSRSRSRGRGGGGGRRNRWGSVSPIRNVPDRPVSTGPDPAPVLYKIYHGRVTNMRDFGAFVQLEGVQGAKVSLQADLAFSS